jgi:hypothetical protein
VSEAEPEAAPNADEPPRPRRKKKSKRAARSAGPGDGGGSQPLVVETPPPLGSHPTALVGAVVAVVSLLLVGTSDGAPSGYTLLALGVGAFLGGASCEQPRRTVLSAMTIAAVGLAWLALSTSPWAIGVAVGGGMALAGGIHLLGRMGPEISERPETGERARGT